MHVRHGVVAAVAVLAVLLLAGCTAPVTPAEPSEPAQSTSTPAPEPTAEPTVDPTDPAGWVIDFGHVGPIAVGAPIDGIPALMTAFTDATQEACPYVLAYDAPGVPSIWLPDPHGTGVIEQILIVGWGAAGETRTDAVRTTAGIGIGSTLAELRAAYPQLIQNQGPYSTVIYGITDDAGHWINFVFDDGTAEDGLIQFMVVRDSPSVQGEFCS